MKLIYSGPHLAVDVIDGNDVVLEGIRRGEAVELDDSVAESLLKQDTWKPAVAPSKTAVVKDKPREREGR